MAWLDCSIDVDDFLNACSDSEIEEVKEWLRDNEVEYSTDNPVKDAVAYMDDTVWNNTIIKLLDKKWQLSKEDEETIIRIANQLP